jgi:hypothetical protein
LDRQFEVDAPDRIWVPPLGRFGFAKSPAGQWTSLISKYMRVVVQSRHLVDRIDDESIWL